MLISILPARFVLIQQYNTLCTGYRVVHCDTAKNNTARSRSITTLCQYKWLFVTFYRPFIQWHKVISHWFIVIRAQITISNTKDYIKLCAGFETFTSLIWIYGLAFSLQATADTVDSLTELWHHQNKTILLDLKYNGKLRELSEL